MWIDFAQTRESWEPRLNPDRFHYYTTCHQKPTAYVGLQVHHGWEKGVPLVLLQCRQLDALSWCKRGKKGLYFYCRERSTKSPQCDRKKRSEVFRHPCPPLVERFSQLMSFLDSHNKRWSRVKRVYLRIVLYNMVFCIVGKGRDPVGKRDWKNPYSNCVCVCGEPLYRDSSVTLHTHRFVGDTRVTGSQQWLSRGRWVVAGWHTRTARL